MSGCRSFMPAMNDRRVDAAAPVEVSLVHARAQELEASIRAPGPTAAYRRVRRTVTLTTFLKATPSAAWTFVVTVMSPSATAAPPPAGRHAWRAR